MGCCSSFVKYLLFIFNFVFVLCGIALIAVGGAILADASGFAAVADEVDVVVQAPPIVLIVIGSLIFIISFLGCCGAIKENKCMLITFGVCLIVIFIIQLVIGIYAVVQLNDNNVEGTLQKIFRDPSKRDMFGSLENSLECCGVRGPTDYGPLANVPNTCCVFDDCRNQAIYSAGCAFKLEDWINSAGKYIGGVALGLAVVEVIGVLCTMIVIHRRKSILEISS